MTDPRKQAFAPYLRRLADLLALKDWRVEIEDLPPTNGASATVFLTYGRRWMQVRLSEEFLASSPDRQRVDLTHELIHCHLEPAWEMATDAMPESTHATFKRLMEYAIDGLAEGIAAHLPLPDNPGEGA